MKLFSNTTNRIFFLIIIAGIATLLSYIFIPQGYLPITLFFIMIIVLIINEKYHSTYSKENIPITKSVNFIPVLVHQLRAPLVSIRWGMAMLLNGEVGTLSTEQKKVADESYRSVDKLMSYIRDILSLTNLDHYQYVFTSVNMKAIINTVINELSREAVDKNIEINFLSGNTTIPDIQADPSKITIVIENLLENAIKYTINGGKVSIAIATEKDGLHMTIKDTGMGIPKGDQEHIFTQFFRAKNALVSHPHGSGIGLYISKDIVQAHHGKIWFDTKENEGTIFHVILPFSLKETVK